tara:strand:+ start:137 stop:967 length:831 start_codon:yes stop_codon:yes gene_type:complete
VILSTKTILDELVDGVKDDLSLSKSEINESDLRKSLNDIPPTVSMIDALKLNSTRIARKSSCINVIAEVKKASPSKGLLVNEFSPSNIATTYEESGASAVSVLTEKRKFLGSLSDLSEVAASVKIPVMRKEFIFDPYQIFEARASGADAILLIATILETNLLADLRLLATEYGMDALVEVYTEKDLERALEADSKIIGVNNRDLKTFKVDTRNTLNIFSNLSASEKKNLVLVSESGINSWLDVEPLVEAGIDAILVGESLMKSSSPKNLIKELRGE